MQKIALFIFISLLSIPTFSQFTVTPIQPGIGGIEVCADSAVFSFEVICDGLAHLNVQLDLKLPAGIEYVDGSLQNLSSTDKTVSFVQYQPQQLTLQGQDILQNERYAFEVKLFATCEMLNDFINGQPFTNTLEISDLTGLVTSSTAPVYNPSIDYGDLSMSVGNTPSGVVGQTVTRQISIYSTGSGCMKNLEWYDKHEGDIRIDSVYFQGQKLQTQIVGDSIKYSFSAAEFALQGNGDGLFCQNDGPLILTEYIYILGCTDKNSTLGVSWGCKGLTCSHFSTSGDVVVNNLQPRLSFQARPNSLESCFYNQSNRKELVIHNTGAGSAVDLEVELKKYYYAGQYAEYKYDGLDPNSVEIRYNEGAFQAVTTHSIEMNTYGNSCSLPYAYRFKLDIPVLLPGDSAIIAFDMVNCVPDSCMETDIRQGAWGYNCRYDQACGGSSTIIANQQGSIGARVEHIFSNVDPSSVVAGKDAWFTSSVQQAESSLEGDGQYLVRYILPNCGMSFSGLASDLMWTNIGGNISWPQTNFQQLGNVIEASYLLSDLPSNFVINGSEVRLKLTGDCSCTAADSIMTLQKEIIYTPDANCSPSAQIGILCDSARIVVDPCIATPCSGVRMLDFTFERANTGLPDSDLDRRPDATGGLSTNIRRDRARIGDTIQAQIIGYVDGTSSFDYGYADLTVELSQYLTPLNGSIRWWDASAGIYRNCAQASPTQVGASSDFRIDFSPSTLSASCTALSGLSYGQGDSIILDVSFVVNGTSNAVLDIGSVYPVEMYMSHVPNPTEADKFACLGSQYSAILQLVSMTDESFITPISASSCQEIEARTYINMFTGGSYTDMFPYEYRSWSFPDTFLVTPPAGFSFVDASVFLRFTPYTQQLPITPVDPNANPLLFDLRALVNNGSLILPDDGYELQFFTHWLPDCDAPSDQAVVVQTEALFDWANGLEVYDSAKVFSPTIQHQSPALSLNNLSATTQDGVTREVSWDIQINNTSINSASPMSWLAFKSPSGAIAVSSVQQLPGGAQLNNLNGIFQLGNINASQTRNFTLTAAYNQCQIDTLWVYTGWSCDNYPTSWADINCIEDSFMLRIDPKPANAQLSMNAQPQDTVVLFSSSTYDFAIRSTQIANVQDLVLDIYHPNNGLDFIAGTAEIEYPLGTGYTAIADPLPIPGGYRFIFADYNSTIANEGLAGLQSGTNNDRQVNIRFDLSPNCNFNSGNIFYARLGGNMPCGDTLIRQRVMEPIVVVGGAAAYTSAFSIRTTAQQSCDISEWELKLKTSGGMTGDYDSLHIWLDTSWVYLPNLFQYVKNNFTDSIPTVTQQSNTRRYSWHLNPSMAGPDSVIFRIGVQNNGAPSCTGSNPVQLIMASTYDVPPICQSSGGGETGRDTLNVISDPAFAPEMQLTANGSSPSLANQNRYSWNVRLEHSSGDFDTPANWISFYSPSGNILVDAVIDSQTGDSLVQQSDYWEAGSIAPLSHKNYFITAQASLCQRDSLYIISGWSCEGYPSNVASFSCATDTILLIAIPDSLSGSLRLEMPISCFGENDAIVSAQSNGGQAPYYYQWSAGNATDSIVQNLGAGWLYLTLNDQNNCTFRDSIRIENPPALAASATAADASCFGYANGSVSAQITGGVAPYSYMWNKNPALNSASLQNQPAGSYLFQVMDSRGCSDSAQTTIDQPAMIVLSTGFEDESCSNANGQAWVNASGGSGGFSYTWSTVPAQMTDTASGLDAGNYTVWVIDQQGCRDSAMVQVSNLAAPTLTVVEARDVSCFGENDGIIHIQVNGGTGQYSYSWSHAALTDSIASSLSSGIYTVSVDDGRCPQQLDISISEPEAISIAIDSLLSPSCAGLQDGMARIAVNGGTSPYTYYWNTAPPQFTETATDLDPGTYVARVTDDRACQDSISISIPDPAVLFAEISKEDAICFNGNSGRASIEVTGGTPPYQYNWSNGDTTQTASQLSRGMYEVTVRDSRGCMIMLDTEIHSPPALTISTSQTDIICFGGSDGQASVNASGGLGPYLFSWSNGQTGREISNLTAGIYEVRLQDGNGCELDTLIEILQPTAAIIADFIAEPDLSQALVGDQADIQFVNLSQGAEQYLWIFGTAGAASNKANPRFLYEEPGTYTIRLIASDPNGNCADTTTQILTLLPPGKLFTANAFSPNGDGFNDVYYVKGEGLVELDFRIYNRFGRLVRHITNLSDGWDGTVDGEPVPEGVYTYVIQATLENGDRVKRAGTISLMR